MRRHLRMCEELLVFTFDILAEIGVVWRVMTNRFWRIFGLKCLKSEQILHREFELGFAIGAATTVFVDSYRLFE